MSDKTPEQIAAELELESQIKEAQDKAAAELNDKKERAGELHFVHEGKVYIPIIPRVNIPGLGKRTALEICCDEEAQQYLIKENCIGSVIKEII